jgi:outer membrane immunogenic protein
MKKTLLSATAAAMIAGITGPAMAADMPVKAYRAPPPVIYNWTGCYLGANAGWVRASVDVNWVADPIGFPVSAPFINNDSVARFSRGGGTAGGQVGCNWQTGQWVWGVETDFNWASSSGHRDIDQTGIVVFTETEDDRFRSFGTLRARLGIATGATGNWLLYVTGGLAWANFRFSDCAEFGVALVTCSTTPVAGATGFNAINTSTTRFGGTVGVGAEVLLSQAWSIKAEYLYMGFRNQSTDVPFVNFPGFGFNPSTTDIVFNHSHLNVQTVRFGLNYHFGNLFGKSAPIYTRY